MSLYDLPYEIIVTIMDNLSVNQIVNMCRVSQYGSNISQDEHLWLKLIYDKYGVNDKILSDKTWYQNYVYMTQLFTPEQLSILHEFNTYSREKWTFLATLYNYQTYNAFYIRAEYGNFPLDMVILYIHRGAIYVIGTPLIHSNTTLEDALIVQLDDYFGATATNTIYIHKHTLKKVYDKGYYIDNSEQVAILNREQLKALSYMYQY